MFIYFMFLIISIALFIVFFIYYEKSKYNSRFCNGCGAIYFDGYLKKNAKIKLKKNIQG